MKRYKPPLALLAVALCAVLAPTLAQGDDRAPRERIEMLVFTYRATGVCPPCDRARPIAKRLARELPITFLYAEDTTARAQRDVWRVERFPTFILIARESYGRAREIMRWSGALDVERRIRAAFERARNRNRPARPAPNGHNPPRPPKRK